MNFSIGVLLKLPSATRPLTAAHANSLFWIDLESPSHASSASDHFARSLLPAPHGSIGPDSSHRRPQNEPTLYRRSLHLRITRPRPAPSNRSRHGYPRP